MIEPDTRISVTLPAQQWNTVLMQLTEGPYRLVAPLVTAIQQQCQQYEQPAPPSPMMPSPRSGNGDGRSFEPSSDPRRDER